MDREEIYTRAENTRDPQAFVQFLKSLAQFVAVAPDVDVNSDTEGYLDGLAAYVESNLEAILAEDSERIQLSELCKSLVAAYYYG